MDNAELAYYKSVCDIQDKFIRGEFDRETLEQKLEIERQNQIIFLTQKVEKLKRDMEKERCFAKLISVAPLGERQYRYKKTGEVYNGQIYVNGECCTDGHGNEIILDYKENI